MFPGTYRITVMGSGLTDAGFDCTYSEDFVPYPIEISDIDISDDRITYTIDLDEETNNIEFPIFNNHGIVVVDAIDIQELR